jgi:hypothetical protein
MDTILGVISSRGLIGREMKRGKNVSKEPVYF